ncbi:MFS transporter [Burkholderia sp. ABCPW 14]|uniref:MFS transporter n=1 Tax=Burkholderia sp. ABCPW 14 TaxID=1637860 RepID=UPI000A427979|nr:MFS transporter [Burkholderia sp. ABCPW 14]
MRSKFNPTLKLALSANLFEWYEFSLTAFMALEIGRLFFPAGSDKTALMLSFSVFASSYLARPLGGVFFGILGNRHGAGVALKFSMIGMAVPASLIAFLPTYRTSGYMATGLLLALKMLQGFCAGGEMPLSGYFVALNTGERNRGLYCAFTVVSGFLGMLLASGTVFALPYLVDASHRFANPAVAGYGVEPWRWPFLLCTPLSILIYLLRSSINQDLTLQTRRSSHGKPTLPLFQAFVLVAFMEVVIYSIFVWMPSYLHSYVGVSSFNAHISNVVSLAIFSASMIVSGYVARFINASSLVLCGVVSLVVVSYPLFEILQLDDISFLLFAQTVFAIPSGCMVGVIFVVLTDLFKQNWGSLGMAITYSFATAIFGGTAPIVCSYLIEVTHMITAPAIYISAIGLLAAPVAYSVSSVTHDAIQLRTSD